MYHNMCITISWSHRYTTTMRGPTVLSHELTHIRHEHNIKDDLDAYLADQHVVTSPHACN